MMFNVEVALGRAPTRVTMLARGKAKSRTEIAFMPNGNVANRALEQLNKELDRVEALPLPPPPIEEEVSPLRRMLEALEAKGILHSRKDKEEEAKES